MKVAIIYASHDGHTKKISQTIANHLKNDELIIDLLNVENCDEKTLAHYEAFVFGSAVRYGKHLKPMLTFLQQHQATLSESDKKTAFFSVNITARKDHRNTPQTSNYVKKFFYRFFDKHIIRFIMWLTKGDTDLNTVKEYTDWQRVEAFSQRLKEFL